MRKIIAIIWKDTRLRFTGFIDLLFFLILPIGFIFLLSGGGVGGPGNTDDPRIPLLLVNADDSTLAAALRDELAASDTVKIQEMTASDAAAAFADEDAPALLTIPAGFADALLAGETAVVHLDTLPNNTNGDAAARAVETAVSTISQPLIAARNATDEAASYRPFADDTARAAYFSDSLTLAQDALDTAPQRVVFTQPETAITDDNGYSPAAHATSGQLITWVFIPLLGTAGFLALERNRGTLRRLMTTPTSATTYLLGVIGASYLQAIVQMTLLIGFGMLVLNVSWGNSLTGLTMVLLAFGLASVAFGVMLGTFIKTESQASNLSIMLGMSMALLGGCWFPLELFPPTMQTVVKVLPTTWAMQGLTDLSMRGLGMTAVLPETAVLLGFALVFFIIGIFRFRQSAS